jgi:transcriptional regulator with XRE-family HTH domain
MIRIARQKLKLGQADLARLLDVDPSYVSRVEHGLENLTFTQGVSFARALGCHFQVALTYFIRPIDE